jgi:hypothetical protein
LLTWHLYSYLLVCLNILLPGFWNCISVAFEIPFEKATRAAHLQFVFYKIYTHETSSRTQFLHYR